MGPVLSKISSCKFGSSFFRLGYGKSSSSSKATESKENLKYDELIKDLPPISDEDVTKYLKGNVMENLLGTKWDLSNAPIRDETDLGEFFRAYPKPDQLQLLTIHKCYYLTSIPQCVAAFSNLTSLDLRDNCLNQLPWSIALLKSLIYLDLSYNMLTSLPRTIGFLHSLEVLNVSANHLKQLPTELLKLENLQELDVSKNLKLASPPLSVCTKGWENVKVVLQKRLHRNNMWEGSKPWIDGSEERHKLNVMKSLLELCIDAIIVMKIDFLLIQTIPPVVKAHLSQEVVDFEKKLEVAKCSHCRNYFSSRETFDNHHCSL